MADEGDPVSVVDESFPLYTRGMSRWSFRGTRGDTKMGGGG